MKIKSTLVLLSLVLALFMQGCTPKQTFSGMVVDIHNQPIDGALVEIGKKSKRTEKGRFTLEVDSAGRYVMNVTKLHFGFVSKIFKAADRNIVITMDSATVVVIPNAEPDDGGTTDTGIDTQAPDAVTITDSPTTTAPLSASIPEATSPLRKIPFVYDTHGNLVAFGDASVVAAYKVLEQFQAPNQGATATVDPDDLEETAEPATAGFFQTKEGETNRSGIQGSLNTIDTYSRDGMPGDFTIAKEDNGGGWMQTRGAVDLSFFRNGKVMQLKKGKHARITIPVDTIAQQILGERLSKTIPIMIYDKKTGFWRQDVDKWTGKPSVGVLNEKRTAYVALVSHFSVFNADETFTNAACIRLCNSATGPSMVPADARVEVPGTWNWSYSFGTGCNNPASGCGAGQNAFGIARLLPSSSVGMRLFDNTGKIRYTYAFVGGAVSPDIHDDNCSTVNNLATCNTSTVLDWSVAEAAINTTPGQEGTMNKPVAAADVVGGKLRISWVYIPDVTVTGTTYDYTTLTPRHYQIEVVPASGTIAERFIDIPTLTTAQTNTLDVDVTTIPYSNTSQAYKFRVIVFVGITKVPSDLLPFCFTADTDTQPVSCP